MAIIQALFAAVTRSAGKVLNTVFAWATVAVITTAVGLMLVTLFL